MPATGLQLQGMRNQYPLEALFVCEQCFGPLEITYDYSGLDAAELKRKIQAGPQSIWRYSDFLPFDGAPARHAAARPDAAAARRPPGRRLGVASSGSRTTP